MKKLLLLVLLPIMLFGVPLNPYKNISDEKKLSALTEYYFDKIAIYPTAPKLTKGEFEKTSVFNKRVEKEKYKYKQLVDKYKSSTQKYKALAMAKAFGALYGKPELGKLKYDADTEHFYTKIYTKNGKFEKNIAIKVPISNAKKFKKNYSKLSPKVVYEFNGNDLVLKNISVKYKNKEYKGLVTNDSYKDSSMVVALNSLGEASLVMGEVSVGVDEELLKLQEENLKLLRRKALQGEKNRLAKSNSKLGVYKNDDIHRKLNGVSQAKVDPKKWLFIISIENYEFADNIIYNKNTAKNFRDVAKKTLGIEDSHIAFMSEDGATAGAIKGKLRTKLRRVEKGDTVYFYYSGHGIPVASKDNEPYMLPADTMVDYVEDEEFFKLKNIYALLTDSKASKVVAIIDACFSGATDNKAVIKGVAAARLKPKGIKIDEDKMFVITAGKDKQYSNKFDDKSNRLFSYYVMDALMDGKRDSMSMYRYVYKNVKDESYKMGDLNLQEPTLMGNKDMSF